MLNRNFGSVSELIKVHRTFDHIQISLKIFAEKEMRIHCNIQCAKTSLRIFGIRHNQARDVVFLANYVVVLAFINPHRLHFID